ncbi:MAG: DarT ssDNA thymidine ADP-ribosyltransferase family protein, partial [Burkholderiales bacterium]|nr:DarT ssDNA thymidine ADP-ribosyltransferase family protein [Burkholderiales bacterium]
MTIEEVLRERRITEILHFTTNTGILGILDTKQLKARDRLNDDARLEYIFTPNAKDRARDSNWHGYVNLSVSRINTWFATSSGNWHRHKGVWWCIVSFSPEILNHEGVIFTTTNNIYTSVKRAPKVDGFEAMFAQKVV